MALETREPVHGRTTAERINAGDPDRYELEGVPLFHLPMPGQGTMVVLSFGTGRADEPAHLSGVTHLAEHLVMDGLGDLAIDGNGRTEPWRVSFAYGGRPAEASRFLRDVATAIREPRLDRIDAEISVLLTEEDGSGRGGVPTLLAWLRYGNTGLGMASRPELILRAPEADVIGGWMRQHLVAGNAAIWLAGDLPDDLALPLPAGERPPKATLTPIRGLETPTLTIHPAPGLGASFVVGRTAAIATGFAIAARRLLRALRIERSLGYLVSVDYLPLEVSLAHVVVHATCQPDRVAEVEGLMLNVLDDLARHGPTQDELDRRLDDLRRTMTDPTSNPGRLDSTVRDVLLGGEPELLADLELEQASLTPASVRDALDQAMRSMLMVVPSTGFVPNRSLRRYPGPSTDLFPSEAFSEPAPKKRPWDPAPPTHTLRIGQDGVAVDDPTGRRLTSILWDECVAVVHTPAGRHVMGRDGFAVDVEASAWQRGERAVRLVDEYAPGDCVVRPSA